MTRALLLVALALTLGCGGAVTAAGTMQPTLPLTRAPDEGFRRTPPPTAEAPPLQAPPMSEIQLANGLTLVVVPRPGWPTVSLGLVTRASELEYDEGALELASAYVARVVALRQPDTALSFGSSMEGAGVSGTAQTRDLETVLTALAEAVHAPLVTEAMQYAQQELLLDEEMSASSPLGASRGYAAQAIYLPTASFDAFRQQRYRAIQRLSPPLVSVVTRDAFRPTETAILLAGDITPEQARALVEPRFAAPYTTRPPQRRVVSPPLDSAVPVGAQAMRSSQLQLVYGLPAPDLDSPDFAAFEVLQAVLAGGFMSSLNTRIRHELGASYGVRWGRWMSAPGRAAFIEARLDSRQVLPALRAFFAELLRVRSAALADAELDRARRIVWGEWEAAFATPAGLVDACERAFMARISLAQLAERVNAVRAVTSADVLAVARARLDPVRNVAVLAGPLESLLGHTLVRTNAGFVVVPPP